MDDYYRRARRTLWQVASLTGAVSLQSNERGSVCCHMARGGISSTPLLYSSRFQWLLPREMADGQISGYLPGVARCKWSVEFASIPPAHRKADFPTLSSRSIAPSALPNSHAGCSLAAPQSAMLSFSRLSPQKDHLTANRFAHSACPHFLPVTPDRVYAKLGRRPARNLQSSITP